MLPCTALSGVVCLYQLQNYVLQCTAVLRTTCSVCINCCVEIHMLQCTALSGVFVSIALQCTVENYMLQCREWHCVFISIAEPCATVHCSVKNYVFSVYQLQC